LFWNNKECIFYERIENSFILSSPRDSSRLCVWTVLINCWANKTDSRNSFCTIGVESGKNSFWNNRFHGYRHRDPPLEIEDHITDTGNTPSDESGLQRIVVNRYVTSLRGFAASERFNRCCDGVPAFSSDRMRATNLKTAFGFRKKESEMFKKKRTVFFWLAVLCVGNDWLLQTQ